MSQAPIPQRHHIDPPGLWGNVILGSAIAHILAFGLFHLISMGSLQKLPGNRDFISVDLISLPAKANTISKAKQPASPNPPRKTSANPLVSRQNFSTATKSPPTTNSQPTKQADNSKTGEKVRSQPPSPKPISPNPTSSPEVNPSPNPSPSQSSEKPTEESAANPQTGFFVTPVRLNLTDSSRDIPSQPAKPKSDNKTEFAIDELNGLGIKPGQVIQLKVTILIDETGKARLPSQEEDANPTQILSGNISIENAKQLANRIIEGWRFQPTYMENTPVTQAYNLEIRINVP